MRQNCGSFVVGKTRHWLQYINLQCCTMCRHCNQSTLWNWDHIRQLLFTDSVRLTLTRSCICMLRPVDDGTVNPKRLASSDETWQHIVLCQVFGNTTTRQDRLPAGRWMWFLISAVFCGKNRQYCAQHWQKMLAVLYYLKERLAISRLLSYVR